MCVYGGCGGDDGGVRYLNGVCVNGRGDGDGGDTGNDDDRNQSKEREIRCYTGTKTLIVLSPKLEDEKCCSRCRCAMKSKLTNYISVF